jgi:hypothetical protein
MAYKARHDHLVDPGAMLAATHELRDGSRVRLRLTRPADLALIRAFLAEHGLPDSAVRRFAFYDPRERMTLAATRPGNRGEELLALAEVAIDEPEPGVFVAEPVRGVGLGSLMASAATTLALQRRRRNAA